MISDLERLKKKMIEKPWLYEEEEHAVLSLAEEAIAFITDLVDGALYNQEGGIDIGAVKSWLKDHE